MFVLSIIKDTIPIQPSHFGLPPEQALITELNKKYANKVLHDVGLCICVFDIAEAGEGKVRYGDGFLWYAVVFRLTVFRPFPSEVILAKVKSSDEDGIHLSVGFFEDMWIPLNYLPQPSAFDVNERAHFWLPSAEATATTHELLDSPTSERMYIDQGEIVRVRVETDEFYDDEPGPPKAQEGIQVVREARRPPYNVTCSIAEQGLGPVAWWKATEEAMDEG
ncbi:polymerase III polypeptide H [Stereum hirsutum FP-91666 SS1]|uniref:polymerase III polypeptide H n=1 Tax=Stereum hirsutum (strain FP-91666) TaxID=721885 RepID=UPI000440D326|nr:polymerase III polypeptide H [Stereum hirsutum FP-91666 SS1]EIM86621.1 polymerase III polypeptide H [Stereum hirsutum FP-91666 SS1]